MRPGPWDVATLGEEQGVAAGTYIVDANMNPLAKLIEDDAENMLAAGPALLAALKEQLAEAAAYEENGSRFDKERNDRARMAIAAAEGQP